MSIHIYRKTGWVGTVGSLNLLVNDEKRKKIGNNEWVEIFEQEATIQTSTFGMKSNKVEVEDGDQLLLTSTFWGLYVYTLLLILLIASGFIRNSFLSGITLLLAILMLISVFIPGAHQQIEKIKDIE